MSTMKRALGWAVMAVAFVLAGTGAAQKPADSVEARIARVEQGLLPSSPDWWSPAPWSGNVIAKGQPDPGMKLADRMAFHQVPGVTSAVINNGAVEWARGYGVLEAGTQTRAA